MKEGPAPVVGHRSGTLRDALKGIGHDSAVERRFPAQQSCLAEVIISLEMAQQIRSPSRSKQRVQRVVGDILTALQLVWFVWHLPRDPTIAAHQYSSESEKRN